MVAFEGHWSLQIYLASYGTNIALSSPHKMENLSSNNDIFGRSSPMYKIALEMLYNSWRKGRIGFMRTLVISFITTLHRLIGCKSLNWDRGSILGMSTINIPYIKSIFDRCPNIISHNILVSSKDDCLEAILERCHYGSIEKSGLQSSYFVTCFLKTKHPSVLSWGMLFSCNRSRWHAS